MSSAKNLVPVAVILSAVFFFALMIWVSNLLISRQSSTTSSMNTPYKQGIPLSRNGLFIMQGSSVDGRDLIYNTSDTEDFIFPGGGVKTIYLNHQDVPSYIIGIFDRLEVIPSRDDRLIYLRHPQSGEVLPVVVLQASRKRTTESLPVGTALGVEIINSNDDPKHIRMISSVSDFGWDKLIDTLRKGDVVILVLKKYAEGNIVLDDKTRKYIGAKLIIRRYVYKNTL